MGRREIVRVMSRVRVVEGLSCGSALGLINE
jgi:hypothetical protein